MSAETATGAAAAECIAAASCENSITLSPDSAYVLKRGFATSPKKTRKGDASASGEDATAAYQNKTRRTTLPMDPTADLDPAMMLPTVHLGDVSPHKFSEGFSGMSTPRAVSPSQLSQHSQLGTAVFHQRPGDADHSPLRRALSQSSRTSSARYAHNPYSAVYPQKVQLGGSQTPQNISPCRSISPRPEISPCRFSRDRSRADSPAMPPLSQEPSMSAFVESYTRQRATAEYLSAQSSMADGLADDAVLSPIDAPLSLRAEDNVKPSKKKEERRKKKKKGSKIRPLTDVPPPTQMKYIPPPPPPMKLVVNGGLISFDSFYRILRRWYERVLACEDSYVARLGGVSCPRMEYYSQSFNQWMADVQHWWTTWMSQTAAERPMARTTSPTTSVSAISRDGRPTPRSTSPATNSLAPPAYNGPADQSSFPYTQSSVSQNVDVNRSPYGQPVMGGGSPAMQHQQQQQHQHHFQQPQQQQQQPQQHHQSSPADYNLSPGSYNGGWGAAPPVQNAPMYGNYQQQNGQGYGNAPNANQQYSYQQPQQQQQLQTQPQQQHHQQQQHQQQQMYVPPHHQHQQLQQQAPQSGNGFVSVGRFSNGNSPSNMLLSAAAPPPLPSQAPPQNSQWQNYTNSSRSVSAQSQNQTPTSTPLMGGYPSSNNSPSVVVGTSPMHTANNNAPYTQMSAVVPDTMRRGVYMA